MCCRPQDDATDEKVLSSDLGVLSFAHSADMCVLAGNEARGFSRLVGIMSVSQGRAVASATFPSHAALLCACAVCAGCRFTPTVSVQGSCDCILSLRVRPETDSICDSCAFAVWAL